MSDENFNPRGKSGALFRVTDGWYGVIANSYLHSQFSTYLSKSVDAYLSLRIS